MFYLYSKFCDFKIETHTYIFTRCKYTTVADILMIFMLLYCSQVMKVFYLLDCLLGTIPKRWHLFLLVFLY